MTRKELLGKVLRAALEEAAQIAERKAAALSPYRDTHAAVQAATAEDIAAEIRALIPRRFF
jgi:hypothetical protein